MKASASKSGCYTDVLDRLKFGVGVRADFAVQIDLFVLRGDPFHERSSLRAFNARRKDSMGAEKRGRGKYSRPAGPFPDGLVRLLPPGESFGVASVGQKGT